MRIRVHIVLVLMAGVTRGVVACLDGRELGETKCEVGTCIESANGGAHAVDGEGLVIQHGVIEGFSIKQWRWEDRPWCFGVVESDDKHGVRIGKRSVPFIVLGR